MGGVITVAGWHTDPTGRHQHRYHDGHAWTAHVADDGRLSVDPLPEVPQSTPPPQAAAAELEPARGTGGWLERRKLAKAAAERDRADLRQLVTAAVAGDEVARERIPVVLAETREAWKPAQLRRLADKTLFELAAKSLQDDVLTQSEQNRLLGIPDDLGLSQDEIRVRHRALWESIVIAGLNDGRMPRLDPADVHIVPKRDEVVYGEWSASLMAEVAVHELRTGSHGISIPLGGGFRYDIGGVRQRTVVVGHELVVEDAGLLAVTATRSVFVGSRKTLEFQHAKLVGLEQFTDGLRLNVSNRQRALLLKIPVDSSPAICGALVMAAARRCNDI